MKTIEQERGKILSGRLALLNDFLVSEKNTGLTFGEYLNELGLTEREFLAQLPDELNLPGLAGAKAESQNLFGYAKAMNLVYYNQFLKHLDKGGKYHSFDADAEDLSAAVIEEGEEFHDAKGKKKKGPLKNLANNIKNEVKNAPGKLKQAIKDPKGAIKNAIDKGKNAIKEAKDKLGDKAKKLGGKLNPKKLLPKLNKFNPAFAAMRGSFRSLLAINLFGIASALNQIKSKKPAQWKKILKKWEIFGGDEKGLMKSINKGKEKNMFPKLKKRTGVDGTLEYYFSAEGAEGDEIQVPSGETEKPPKDLGKIAVAAAAGLGGAAGILAAIPGAQPAAVYVGSSAAVIGAFVPILKSVGKEEGEDTTGIPDPPESKEPLDPDTKEALDDVEAGGGEEEGGEGFFAQYKIPIFITGGLFVATAIGLAIRAFVKGKK